MASDHHHLLLFFWHLWLPALAALFLYLYFARLSPISERVPDPEAEKKLPLMTDPNTHANIEAFRTVLSKFAWTVDFEKVRTSNQDLSFSKFRDRVFLTRHVRSVIYVPQKVIFGHVDIVLEVIGQGEAAKEVVLDTSALEVSKAEILQENGGAEELKVRLQAV